MGRPKIELKGQKFGKLTVLACSGKSAHGNYMWECLCECGNTTVARAGHLRDGQIKSCGCLLKTHAITHARARTVEYQIWSAIKRRCNNPNSTGYESYGGRGISYDPRWESFENFLEDMGERPSKEYSIERINVNLGYSKDNCVWTKDNSLQSYNRRMSKMNKSGRTGVYFKKSSNKWWAEISKNGVTHYLGSFVKYEDAVKARESAEVEYYGFTKE